MELERAKAALVERARDKRGAGFWGARGQSAAASPADPDGPSTPTPGEHRHKSDQSLGLENSFAAFSSACTSADGLFLWSLSAVSILLTPGTVYLALPQLRTKVSQLRKDQRR